MMKKADRASSGKGQARPSLCSCDLTAAAAEVTALVCGDSALPCSAELAAVLVPPSCALPGTLRLLGLGESALDPLRDGPMDRDSRCEPAPSPGTRCDDGAP